MSLKFLMIYSITVLIASITPGPSMLLALNHGIKYGVKRAFGTAMGNVAATFIQAVLSMIGLSAVLLRSATIFTWLKYLGAGYLAYIGIRTFLATEAVRVPTDNVMENQKFNDLFSEAFFVTISNPKAIIFLTAVFPRFIDPKNDTYLQSIIIVAILLATTFLCMMTYSFFGQKIIGLLNQSFFRRAFNRIVGGAFLGMGIGLAGMKVH